MLIEEVRLQTLKGSAKACGVHQDKGNRLLQQKKAVSITDLFSLRKASDSAGEFRLWSPNPAFSMSSDDNPPEKTTGFEFASRIGSLLHDLER